MHLAIKRQQLKSAMLPIAIVLGAVFYKWIGYLSFLSPYLIFVMLFVTYCKLNLSELKPKRAHLLLIAAQMALCAAVYLLVVPWDSVVAEGLFICVFMPTATAAPVVTAMLGGSISFVATYSLLCNLVIALAGPFVLAAIGEAGNLTFMQSTLMILSKVAPLLICPLIVAIIVRYATPNIHRTISEHQSLSFYLWTGALIIIVGNCVSFVINTWQPSHLPDILMMVAGAMLCCGVQYIIGRKIGASLNKSERLLANPGGNSEIPDYRVSAAQSLMQKNTVIGVWLALTYMNSLASVAAAAYIAWHNLLNSWQLWRHERNKVSAKMKSN